MYSTEGVLPNNVNLFRPQAWGAFTVFNAFSSPFELQVLWGQAPALKVIAYGPPSGLPPPPDVTVPKPIVTADALA